MKEKINLCHNELITPYLKGTIEKTGYDVRLKKQFISDEREIIQLKGEFDDVAADKDINILKGLLHRYPTKALIFLTEKCLGHCRFCFRKHLTKDNFITENEFDDIINYLKKNPKINEVIFSGGDPFAIPAQKLIDFVRRIREISTIKIIRLHTRVLTYNPELITKELVTELTDLKPIFFVFHINSHLEITPLVEQKVRLINEHGISCFSQTALLHEVNDSFNDLSQLFMKLIEIGIKPYYLFHPDKVTGTSHFYLSLSNGIELYRQLYNRISGLAMPIYLFNIPGGHGHGIIDLGNFIKIDNNKYQVKTWEGKDLIYEE